MSRTPSPVKHARLLRVSALAAFLLVVPPRASGGTIPVTPARSPILSLPVADVVIQGEVSVTREQILDAMETRAGVPVDASLLSHDLKRLYRILGLRTCAYLEEGEEGTSGPVLTLEVDEEPAYRNVTIVGVPESRAEELREELQVESMFYLPEHRLKECARTLERRLQSEGFCYATVGVGGADPLLQEASLVVDEGPRLMVGAVDFEGLSEIPESSLLDVMQTRPPEFWIFESHLDPDALDRDLLSIEQFAAEEGFLDAAARLEELVISEDDNRVEVQITVEEGERYTVGTVQFQGNESYTHADLLGEIVTRPGDPLRMQQIREDVRKVELLYGRNGHVRSSVDAFQGADEGDHLVRVTFRVDEGKRKTVRGITISGNTRTRDEVILREVRLAPGDVANVEELRKSARRLRDRAYFRDERGKNLVRMEFRETEDPFLEDVAIEVEEGETGWLYFTLGATTDLGFFAGVSLQKTNFDLTDLPSSWNPVSIVREFIQGDAFHGGGQQLTLRVLPGTERSDFRLSFREPYWLGPTDDPVSLSVELFDRRLRLFDEFTEERFGFGAQARTQLSEHWRGGLSGTVGFVTIDDLDDAPDDVEEVEGTSFVPLVGVSVGYRENAAWPAEGTEFEFDGRYELLGADAAGQRLWAEAAWKVPVFQEMFEGNHRIRYRLGAGAQHAFGGDVPFYERFQAGGTTGAFPIRGFRYRRVGPEEENVTLGGDLGYSMTLEYQFPIYATYDSLADEQVEHVRGAFFVDAGSIENDLSDLVSRPRLAAGVGVSVTLPYLGGIPLGADLGLPLLFEPGDEFEFLSARVSTRF